MCLECTCSDSVYLPYHGKIQSASSESQKKFSSFSPTSKIEMAIFVWILITGAFLYFLRKYLKGGQFHEDVSLTGKVAIVTGSNSGIGLETVKGLNKSGAKVYMFCRDEKRCKEAIEELVKDGCDASRLIFGQCDVSSFESIKDCVARFTKVEQKVDILINNAGIMFYPKFELTANKHETTWQTNHLGPFLLTELMLPLVEKSDNGRIVNVASTAQFQCHSFDLKAVDDPAEFTMIPTYARTKIANVMHARELTKRLQQRGVKNVSVNSVHPGFVATNLGRFFFLNGPVLHEILTPFRCLFLKTAEDGAQTSLYCAMSKEVNGVSGKYFSDCKPSDVNPIALDDKICEELYQYSKEQTAECTK